MARKLIGAIATKWHKILGYIGPNTIKQLLKHVNGVELGYNGDRYVMHFYCTYSKFNFIYTAKNKDKATVLPTI